MCITFVISVSLRVTFRESLNGFCQGQTMVMHYFCVSAHISSITST